MSLFLLVSVGFSVLCCRDFIPAGGSSAELATPGPGVFSLSTLSTRVVSLLVAVFELDCDKWGLVRSVFDSVYIFVTQLIPPVVVVVASGWRRHFVVANYVQHFCEWMINLLRRHRVGK